MLKKLESVFQPTPFTDVTNEQNSNRKSNSISNETTPAVRLEKMFEYNVSQISSCAFNSSQTKVYISYSTKNNMKTFPNIFIFYFRRLIIIN